MTEVIRKAKPWRRRATCSKCESLLDYGREDLRVSAVGNVTYLVCPVCQHWMFTNAAGHIGFWQKRFL